MEYTAQKIGNAASRLFILPALLCLASACTAQSDSSENRQLITRFFEKQAKVRYFYQAAMDPAGKAVAWSVDNAGHSQIGMAVLSPPERSLRISASATGTTNETEPRWSPDGREIAFLSDAVTPGQSQVFVADAVTGQLLTRQPLTRFDGYVSHLGWSPDGKQLSVLYVEKASREPSPMAAENKAVGLIDSMVNRDIQRIAVIARATGETREVTPASAYVFEYDWSPDGQSLAYTAAAPPGDNNWYVARLYRQSLSDNKAVMIYKPAFQVAVPRWSPDGKKIAFIEGLMSDQGGTGGEIFAIDSDGNTPPENLTPGRSSTPSWFAWTADGNMIFSEFTGGSTAVNKLIAADRSVRRLSSADESMHAGNEEMSLSIAAGKALTYAYIRFSWTLYPEVWVSRSGKLTQITHLNASMPKIALKPENIRWQRDGQQVQGWLLPPVNYDSSKKYPMLVCAHGGPAWITTPTWSAPDYNSTVYPELGYFVFFPNPRGSYGQGEKFTLANRRDWGFGDLQDILSGMDSVVKRYPVDSLRIGIYGWSYGGASSMFAVTQTRRFRAAVAGAGAADWLSYYGQNSIDKWMDAYFGASPYDDPDAYQKCSAMTYIKQVQTPTLVLVGERDGEAPPPQSRQFWHALKELRVPTQLMIYADEGHSFEKFENMIDVSLRTINWFGTYLK